MRSKSTLNLVCNCYYSVGGNWSIVPTVAGLFIGSTVQGKTEEHNYIVFVQSLQLNWSLYNWVPS